MQCAEKKIAVRSEGRGLVTNKSQHKVAAMHLVSDPITLALALHLPTWKQNQLQEMSSVTLTHAGEESVLHGGRTVNMRTERNYGLLLYLCL